IYIDDFDMQDIVLENKPDKKLMNTFYAYGFIGLILDWVMNDFPIDVEKFSSQLVQIFKYSVGTIQIKKIN
ncbi:MAG: TetR family transcriptional regulator C-terminal domain-containing protein, partial [Kurthia sp.]|nr:TetR family transcriptional regulator C-terminal domain-containing protein [Candidatus Kurthia equi]